MATPLEMNFKKLCGEFVGPDLENPTEYRQFIGALMFLVNTRPNICFFVNILSQFMAELIYAHMVVAKNVLRYLHGTKIYYWRRETTWIH